MTSARWRPRARHTLGYGTSTSRMSLLLWMRSAALLGASWSPAAEWYVAPHVLAYQHTRSTASFLRHHQRVPRWIRHCLTQDPHGRLDPQAWPCRRRPWSKTGRPPAGAAGWASTIWATSWPSAGTNASARAAWRNRTRITTCFVPRRQRRYGADLRLRGDDAGVAIGDAKPLMRRNGPRGTSPAVRRGLEARSRALRSRSFGLERDGRVALARLGRR